MGFYFNVDSITPSKGNSGGGSVPIIDELNITPTTSAQTITAPEGTDGYSPVNVSAVTSSIDANIVASNIKDGVSILGVNGTLVGTDTVTATNATGSAITAGDKVWLQKENGSWKIKSFYSDEVNFVNHGVSITNKIASGFDANHYMYLKDTFSPGSSPWEVVFKFKPSSLHRGSLMTKMSGAPYYGFRLNLIEDGHMYYIVSDGQYSETPFEGEGSGSYIVNAWNWVKVEFTGSAYNAYLSTDGINWTLDKTVTSSTPIYSYTAQTNIGYFPDGSPVCWLQGEMDLSECYININGYRFWSPFYETSSDNDWQTGVALENIASNATGDVGLGDFGRKYGCTINNFLGDIDANGVLQRADLPQNIIFSGVKSLSQQVLAHRFETKYISGLQKNVNIIFPDLENVTTDKALESFIENNNTIYSVQFLKLKTINGYDCFSNFSYSNNSAPIVIDVSKVETISGYTSMYRAFPYIPKQTTFNFHSLKTISGERAMMNCFEGINENSQVDFSNLETISGQSTMLNCFYRGRFSVQRFQKLNDISQSQNCFQQAFSSLIFSCDIYFDALTSTSFGTYTNQFSQMLSSSKNCTVHFPSNLQSVIGSWSDVVAGFGGTNTTVLFDLPATE